MEEIKNMSNEDLDMAIEDKYGVNWDLTKAPADDPLIAEFWRRIERASD